MDSYNIISYFDILGFRNKVIDPKSKDKDIYNNLKTFKSYFYRSVYLDRANELYPIKDKHITYFSFSDTIVRLFHIKDLSSNINKEFIFLSLELYDIANAQFSFIIHQGEFIRGAISSGYIYRNSKDNILFGRDYIKCYDLAESTAIYPRIIINPILIDKLKFLKDKYKEIKAYDIFNTIFTDFDGCYVLDYLHLYLDSEKEIQHKIDSIAEHKRIVTFKLDFFKDNIKIYQKYNWVKQYHNRTIESFIKKSGETIFNKYFI